MNKNEELKDNRTEVQRDKFEEIQIKNLDSEKYKIECELTINSSLDPDHHFYSRRYFFERKRSSLQHTVLIN